MDSFATAAKGLIENDKKTELTSLITPRFSPNRPQPSMRKLSSSRTLSPLSETRTKLSRT